MDKKVLVLLAEGFEEMEAVITSDLCIRAGLDVCTAGIDGIDVTGSHGLSLIADCELVDIDDEFDAIVIPGGMPGAKNIADNDMAMELIQAHADAGKLICAICAAPGVTLGNTDILSGRKATCFPGCQDNFKSDVKYVDEMAVTDGNVITAKGPGAAPAFAFAIIKALLGQEAVDKVRSGSFF